MATRSQVFIKDTGVYLYQHYDGDGLMQIVCDAVNSDVGRDRQSDPEYLTRIIFCAMLKNSMDGSTGYGIGTEKHGDIVFLVTVDCKKRTITENDGTEIDHRVLFN
jgi:hypothetical protein